MRAGSVVVIDVRRQDAAQVALVEDDEVIQTLATYRTDDPLDVRVLPRWSWRDYDLYDPHRPSALAEARALRRVTVSYQVAGSGIPGERFS